MLSRVRAPYGSLIGELSNGRTRDFGSRCGGSNPPSPAWRYRPPSAGVNARRREAPKLGLGATAAPEVLTFVILVRIQETQLTPVRPPVVGQNSYKILKSLVRLQDRGQRLDEHDGSATV